MNAILDEKSNRLLESVSHETLKDEYGKLYINNKELLDSLYYAASVQQGLLPQERHFKRLFDEYFILYRPLQIIGGDLYWVAQKNNIAYFAVADCTGHGVAGAMLSVLAVSFLNYALFAKDYDNLGQILYEIDKKWLETFNFSFDYLFDNDWMELSLASFNFETRELKFSGANNNILIVNQNQLKEIKGDSYPIGGWQIEKDRKYKEHSIFLNKNTVIYLGSDGFKDQFGGKKEKRYKRKNLYDLLKKISIEPLAEQKIILEDVFNTWKSTYPQTDDVCVMGIRL